MFKIAEYEALRATIRERGTARMCLILAGVIAWGLLTLALNASEFERTAALVPLLVLATTFEISFFIHTGVERVGRYLQVFYEERPALSEPQSGESKGWEETAMAYGQTHPGGTSPLFIPLFSVIAFVNFAAALPAATRHPGWIGISILAHVVFGWRLFSARGTSAGQRALDLDRFRALKKSSTSNSPTSN